MKNQEQEKMERKKRALHLVFLAICISAMAVGILFWMSTLTSTKSDAAEGISLDPTSINASKETKLVTVTMTDFLEELGASSIADYGDKLGFEVNGYRASLYQMKNNLPYLQFFVEENPVEALQEKNSVHAAKVLYLDPVSGYALTDTQVRCIDYVGFCGEFYRNGNGNYCAVDEDIRIYLLGEEPEDYEF